MPGPDRWEDLYATVKSELDARLRTHTEPARKYLAEALMQAVVPHVESAYKRGLMAGRSRAEYEAQKSRLPLAGRHLEVARLAAAGLTNKEIGKRLFLSENTIKTHLSRAMRRIGARSRGHLAALLAVHGQVTSINVPDPTPEEKST